jgi:predicted transcriptional regulator
MGRTAQEELQIQHRRQQVAEKYLQGWIQAEIARHLSVSQATVSSDLKAIRREWRDSRIRDFDEAVNLELQKLQLLEREAWQGWQRSQEPVESTRVVQSEGGKKAEKTVRRQNGDPRFLELVNRASVGRRALLGLDAPTLIAPTSPSGDQSYYAFAMQELLKLAEQAQGGPTIIDAEFLERQLRAADVPTPGIEPSSQPHE